MAFKLPTLDIKGGKAKTSLAHFLFRLIWNDVTANYVAELGYILVINPDDNAYRFLYFVILDNLIPTNPTDPYILIFQH